MGGALPQTQTCDRREGTAPNTGEEGKIQRGSWRERSRLRAPAQHSLWAGPGAWFSPGCTQNKRGALDTPDLRLGG